MHYNAHKLDKSGRFHEFFIFFLAEMILVIEQLLVPIEQILLTKRTIMNFTGNRYICVLLPPGATASAQKPVQNQGAYGSWNGATIKGFLSISPEEMAQWNSVKFCSGIA